MSEPVPVEDLPEPGEFPGAEHPPGVPDEPAIGRSDSANQSDEQGDEAAPDPTEPERG